MMFRQQIELYNLLNCYYKDYKVKTERDTKASSKGQKTTQSQ